MNKTEFITQLLAVFPPDKNYADVLRFYEGTLSTGKDIDWKKLMQIVGKEYKFKSTPPTSWLLDQMQLCKVYEDAKPIDFDKRLKRTINGYEYEFTAVDSSWQKSKSLSEIDRVIEWQNKKDNK